MTKIKCSKCGSNCYRVWCPDFSESEKQGSLRITADSPRDAVEAWIRIKKDCGDLLDPIPAPMIVHVRPTAPKYGKVRRVDVPAEGGLDA